MWRSDSSFRDLLPSRPRRRNSEIWFQALEFAVSCTVAKYIFYCGRKGRISYSPFKNRFSCAPCADSRNTRHRTPLSLPMPALTRGTCWPCYCSSYDYSVFLGRAAEEQRSTFCTADATELCMSYVTNHMKIKNTYVHIYEYMFYSKKYTWLQYKKRQIQTPGTTFSNFGNEVGMEGGHGNCCRFVALTGVHQGAHISLAKYCIKGKVRS